MKNILVILVATILLSSCTSDNNPTTQNTSSLDFTEVMSFEVDTLDIDMKSVLSENSFYITYSADNLNSENVLKYNLNTQSQIDLTHGDGSQSRQLEVIDNMIYSFGVSSLIKYDLNLNNLNWSNQFYGKKKHRITKYDNDVLIISGRVVFNPIVSVNDYEMKISRFESINEIYSDISTFPYGIRFQADGIVYNDKLYMFGGTDESINYSELNVYDLINDTWNQETLPYGIYESFTSLYNDSVLVTGNKESDNSNAFIGVYDIATNTFIELATSLDLNNITIRGITIINDEVYIAYADWVSPMPNLITIKVVKASLL
ncbi:hypothetical protein HSX10_14750 [Winogradskyella undariae]|uniref:hypothetical protein n=1 Tax=Winogradskyella undariae TaxID=1285465 RepID=UPI00156BA699|nr:hypothetical protein [Winogradskyella undariae]NRR92830.1 hypothetical protein [Winogradskyella undariae]